MGDKVTEPVIAGFMILMGVGIGAVWTLDITRRSPEVDWSAGLFRARTASDGTPLLPHWIAEYGTAAALVTGAIGLVTEQGWGTFLALAALGALVYTSVNSLGWTLARPERRAYAAPMLLGAAGGVLSIAALLVR
jgi:hypothetical protein